MNIHGQSPRTRQSTRSVLYNVRMHSRTIALTVASFILGTISVGIVYAWSGPTAAPPDDNVAAPINVGSTDQVKNGGLGINSLAVFGNSLFGGSAGSNAYLNFGDTSGSSGYGIRDNVGTLEFKNEGGSWDSMQTIVYNLVGGTSPWETSGNDIYNTNTGRVGIGRSNPVQILDAYVGSAIDGLRVSTSDSGSLVLRRNAPGEFVLGSFDSASTLRFVTNSQSRFQVDGSGNFTIWS